LKFIPTVLNFVVRNFKFCKNRYLSTPSSNIHQKQKVHHRQSRIEAEITLPISQIDSHHVHFLLIGFDISFIHTKKCCTLPNKTQMTEFQFFPFNQLRVLLSDVHHTFSRPPFRQTTFPFTQARTFRFITLGHSHSAGARSPHRNEVIENRFVIK
jgi:hypothetical protein